MTKEMINILGEILTNILTALYEPFGFSILLSFFAMFLWLFSYDPNHAGKGFKIAIITWFKKFRESLIFRKLFLLVFVTSTILFRTLLNRNICMNPLSNIMGGWGIWVTMNGVKQLTTESIENVIMMVPFTGILLWTFEKRVGSHLKNILCVCIKVAFCFSLTIETLQILLWLGTFQLSDIFYNTLGGVIGGLIYYVLMKVRKRL